MKKVFPFILAAMEAVLSLSAFPVSVDNHAAIGLEEKSGFFFNADPRLGIIDVAAEAEAVNFSPIGNRLIWVGRNAPAAWLRFTIPVSELGVGYSGGKNDKAVSQWLLVVRPSFSIILDHVDVYIPRSDGGFEEFKSGAKKDVRPGEPYSRYFVFELPPGAFEGKPCYIRLESATDVSVNFDLETSLDFARREVLDYSAYGILYGILLAMVLYSFFHYISLKDIASLYYIFYIAAASLWLFFVQGHAKLIFGQHPCFDQAMLWLWVGMMLSWGAIFTSSFLRLKEGHPLFSRIFAGMAVLGAVVSIAGIAGWDDIAFSLSHYLGIILPLLVIGAAIARLAQGFPSALYFLIAWSFLAVGGLVFSLMGLKVLPVNFWTVNGVAIGVAAEAILLSMALTDRFRRIEIEKKRLEKIQAHYKELSLTDALTGLHNKRFLMNELNIAVSRAVETGEPLSIILLDIDDFKTINDSFGHSLGDEILTTLAHSTRSCTRESDSICRFGGDELVIIMPGNIGQGAYQVAERIRLKFALENQREIEDVEMKATVSLGVVSFNGKESAEALLSRADSAMYEAKHLGKNRSVLR